MPPIGSCRSSSSNGPVTRQPPTSFAEAGGMCISCHANIEDAHPKRLLYCTDCHGGDDTTRDLDQAHVQASQPMPVNPTIIPLDYADQAYLQFLNPANLRVVPQTCGKADDGFGGSCHQDKYQRVIKSMMATTAGHLAGGAYQNGILPDRKARWGNMAVADLDGDVPHHLGALDSLSQVPGEDQSFAKQSFQRHYSDVPRKICARCHLWSRGKAVRGIPGQEGNYRSEGCAACHMQYANDGLSRSRDWTIPKTEVGHPITHRLTTAINTEQCAHCHTRGARIGLSFQGLSQLPPGTATGPSFPGLTPNKVYGAYHVQDSSVNPPDIHSQLGMHCIDCHTADEIMGDGNIYGHMDQATEIECEDCHGMPGAYGDLRTDRGTELTHVRVENSRFILRSKVTGKDHVIPQVKDIIDPQHTSYNARAAKAMNGTHLKAQGGLECYACHSAWQNNCFGCHFERDLRTTALDYVKGIKTKGQPKTDKKYFVNFKNFAMGYNAEGKIAPYTVGCQTMATVTDETGSKILDQVLPKTAAGESGLAINAVNPHTTRDTPRYCTECHRSGQSLGLGSELFTLSRSLLFTTQIGATPGLKILDRKSPAVPSVIGFLPLSDPRGLAVKMDTVNGTATLVYVADAVRGMVTVDVSNPAVPVIASTTAATGARHLALTAGRLYVVGNEGLLIFSLADPAKPARLSTTTIADARAVRFAGTYAYVAAGGAGLLIVDVLDPTAPVLVTTVDLNGASAAPNDASDLLVFSHYGNPPASGIKPFQLVCYVADGAAGIRSVIVDDPHDPSIAGTFATTDAQRLFAASLYDKGDGIKRSLEREYLYVADGVGGLRILDISTPATPQAVPGYTPAGSVVDVLVAHAFEPPHNKLYAYLSVVGRGLTTLDVSVTGTPTLLGEFPALVTPGIGLAIERIRLDRFVDETGKRLKDTSHEGARPFTRSEMERILRADISDR